jgi:steroid 5-alpha reductase family enzyme
MSRISIIELTFLFSLVVITGCWLYGLRHNNDLSIIDGYYGMASLFHAVLTYGLWEERTARGLVMTVLVSAWAIGFGQALARRWYLHRHDGGDNRYRAAAKTLGMGDGVADDRGFIWKSYFLAWPQAVLIGVLNFPIQLAIMSDAPGFRPLEWLGFAVLAAGGTIEVVSNRQLELFKRSNRQPGSTLMTGLWGWSRHPNYFGNACVYTGAAVVAMASDGALWWVLVSPVVILVTLRWGFLGTGVHGTDKLMLAKRYGDPVYLDYVAHTPTFFPRPPRLRLDRRLASGGTR